MTCNGTDTRSCEEIGSVGISVMALSLGIIFALSVTLNGIVCLVFYKKPHLLSVSNSFVLNLSCCELALSLLVLPFTLTSVFSTGWIFSDTWCKIQGYLLTVCQVAIQLSLMVISVDRYYAIINSLRYPYIFTQRLCYILIAFAWVLSLIVSVPPLAGLGQYDYNFNKYTCALNVASSRLYLILLSTSAFLVPLLLQSWCYLSIFRAAVSHTKRRSKVYPSMPSTIRDPPSDSSENSEITHSVQVHYRNMECKAVRTILLIAFAYAVCWVPYFVSSLSVLTGDRVYANTDSAAICFVFLSGIVNPVIYAFMNRITRYEINKFFCDAVSRVSGKTTTLNDSDDYSTTMTNYSSKQSTSQNRFRTGNKGAATSSKGMEMNTIQEESETDECTSKVHNSDSNFPNANCQPDKYEKVIPVKEIVLDPSTLYIHSSKRKKSVIKVLPKLEDEELDTKSRLKDIEEIDKHWDACVNYTTDSVKRQRKSRANSEFLSRGETFMNNMKDYGSFLYFDGHKLKRGNRTRGRSKRRGRLSLDILESNTISRHVSCLQSIHETELDVIELHGSQSNGSICSKFGIPEISKINDFNYPTCATSDSLQANQHRSKHQRCMDNRPDNPLWLACNSNVRSNDDTLIRERNCFSA